MPVTALLACVIFFFCTVLPSRQALFVQARARRYADACCQIGVTPKWNAWLNAGAVACGLTGRGLAGNLSSPGAACPCSCAVMIYSLAGGPGQPAGACTHSWRHRAEAAKQSPLLPGGGAAAQPGRPATHASCGDAAGTEAPTQSHDAPGAAQVLGQGGVPGVDLQAAPLDGKAKLALQAAVALMAVGGGVFGARP